MTPFSLPDPGFDQPNPASPPARLSGPEKAAIIVRLLLAERVDVPLRDLPEPVQAALALQMGRMRPVDRATLALVVEEFCARLDGLGLTFPRDVEGALDMMEGQMSPGAASRLRLAGGAGGGDDPWLRIGAAEPDKLIPLIEAESNEVAAIVLSKIAVPKAAEILGRLPGDRARRIAYAVSLTQATPPAVVEAVGRSIAAELAAEPPRAFDAGPVERVGAILNFSQAATRDLVLDGLTETDAGFADQVRKAIFTFAHIPTRIDPRDLPKIVRAVDQPVLIAALAGAQGADTAAAEFILSGISQRLAQTLREEMAGVTKQSAKDAEAAMTAVVGAIRNLEAEGELFLIAEEETA